MPDLQTYLEFNDPLTIMYRTGTPEDPYKPRSDSLPVINNIVTLLEIPSDKQRVHIAGFTEISKDLYKKKTFLAENEFLVDYSNGVVQFHPIHEGRTLLCSYYGRGLILYPASRIYALVSRSPDIVVTLQDIINDIQLKVAEFTSKIDETNLAIENAIHATANANTAADNANTASELAYEAANKAIDAYETTRLVFKPYVDAFEDIQKKYPDPEIGWTVQVQKTGIRYRWNGTAWVPIDIFGGAIPLASEILDGLLSKEDFKRLKIIDEATYSKRVIVLAQPSYPLQGAQQIRIRCPFNGTVLGIKALCGIKGDTETELSIEKSRDMVTWKSIFLKNLRLMPGQYFDNGSAVISDASVSEGDLFRLNVIKQGENIQNITVEITIKTENT